MTTPFRIPLRIVFYKEGEFWIAHCLEFDLLGDGATKVEALESLNGAIDTQIKATLKFNNLANLFSPAEGKYFAMFAAGKDVAVGELKLQIESITIDDVESREYSDSDSDMVLV